ncbi:MAG: nitroreductase family protein [Alphaproteobacteria bacterium]|nr:MAG: nitroreductase family protein [Alphaproteobacteria bacterium]
MDIFSAIKNRRSSRTFIEKKISQEMLEKLIYYASLAPSPKNRQPWKAILLQDSYKDEFVTFSFACIESLKKQERRFGSLEISLNAMKEADSLFIIYNPFWEESPSEEKTRWQECDLQAIGAMVENLILSATACDIGSLWINDFRFIKKEIQDWLVLREDIIAIVALGYMPSLPFSKRRKSIQDILEVRQKKQ